MPDLGDFYAFKMTSSGSRAGGGRSNNSHNSGGGDGCITALIVFAIVGFVLWFVGEVVG